MTSSETRRVSNLVSVTGDAALAGAEVYCQFTVTASPLPEHLPPLPVDLICLCDCSGSMAWSSTGHHWTGITKIQQLHRALGHLINQMSEHDRLSVLTFNNRLHLTMDLKPMTEANKIVSRMVVQQALARPLGGTRLYDSILEAPHVINYQAHPHRVGALVVLTDGQDDNGSDAVGSIVAQIMEQQARFNLPLYFIALGFDHNQRLLASLEEYGATCAFLETDAELDDVYQRVFTLLKGLAVQAATLSIEVPHHMPDPEVMTKDVPPRQRLTAENQRILDFPLQTLACGVGSLPGEVRQVQLRYLFPSAEAMQATCQAEGVCLSKARVVHQSLYEEEPNTVFETPWLDLCLATSVAEMAAAEARIALERVRMETAELAHTMASQPESPPTDLTRRLALLRHRSDTVSATLSAESGDPYTPLVQIQAALQELDRHLTTPPRQSTQDAERQQSARASEVARRIQGGRCISSPLPPNAHEM
jgi:hypothetical protein